MEYKNGVCRYELKSVTDILKRKDPIYEEYLDEFERAQNGENVGKPMYIVLEVNNYCNMRCKMCIRSMDEGQNSSHVLKMELIDKVLGDIEELDIPSVFLGGGAECLINPDIKEIIKKIRTIKRTVSDDVLITNGYELSDDIIDLLIEEGWEKIFISLDAATQSTYQKIRGRELAHVERRIQRLIDRRREANSSFPIIRVSFVVMDENDDEQKMFFDKWKDKVEIIDFQKLTVYNKEMAIKSGLPMPKEICKQPFSRMEVDSFGNIFPCCSEWNKHIKLGNIENMHLKDAWNGPLINKIRDSWPNHVMEVCRTCLYRE
ncbi:MAG: radical SAM protein [Eubacterium sp.]|nr:radical SAM protein [Eubacterium sp.]